MIQSEKTLKSITNHLTAFSPKTYGITKREETGPPILHMEHFMFPIRYMRVLITTQNRKVQLREDDFPSDYRLVMDGRGEEPAKARLVLTQGLNDIIITTGDITPISGLVFVVADVVDGQFFSINALFSADDDQQLSSILCDMSKELLMHWSLQNRLIEMGEQDYAGF